MCFGAIASFSSSTVLAALGIATVRRVQARKDLLYAATPLIFAVHQFNEGLIWLNLENGGSVDVRKYLTFAYLVVALLLWPAYCPMSVWLREESSRRRTFMLPFFALGVILGGYLFVQLVAGQHDAAIVNCSIYYTFDLPVSEIGASLVYVAVVFGTALFSANRSIVRIGAINILFACIAAAVYYKTFISVWCFFASMLSAMIYLFFRNSKTNSANRIEPRT